MSTLILISSDIEWQATLSLFPAVQIQRSPLGSWFATEMGPYPIIFFHGGWGKISAAATTQYVIDRWAPKALINLGTCGGFQGEIERGEILLVEKAIVYDILEQMTDSEAALAHYTTDVDLTWLLGPLPQPVRRSLIVSGDRDLIAEEVPWLKQQFGAVAGDWESGAIAWVAARNGVRSLILRGVSDLVGPGVGPGPGGGEAYDGNVHVFAEAAATILRQLVEHLPAWIAKTESPSTGCKE